tara:strand:- start:201 stop:1259 length:1059 start_codon:yes stop_codon:yes gene_type:complete
MKEYQAIGNPTSGSLRFNTDSSKLEIYNGEAWWEIDATSPELQTGGTRGIIATGRSDGGGSQTKVNNIQFINIATTGNAVDFGDAIDPNSRGGGTMSSRTRGIISRASDDATMEFITISSTGNSAEFGEDTVARNGAIVSSQTRGLNMSGNSSVNSISYVTIAQLGNAVDFGDITAGAGIYGSSGLGNATRGIAVCGRIAPSPSDDGNVMHFVTISTLGNSSDFGDLTANHYASGTAANATRGIIFGARNGGHPNQSNMIDFVTIASLGNSVRFGELNKAATPYASYDGVGVSSPVRAVYCGGYGAPAPIYDTSNVMEYIQFSTTGNAIDFGDLAQKVKGSASISNGHGGLG